MDSAWKEYVHKGLRDQPVADLYDYFDFHRNRQKKFSQLSFQVSSGSYEPRSSQIARLEKKVGLCRPIVIPTPEDAVVMQCITEELLSPALKAQPSENVFFSRSHSTPQTKLAFGRDYIWFRRYKRFANLRIEISSVHDWLVVTDVANYFDTIIHAFLRNQLAELDGVKEPILDILFRIIPYVSWKPDYLPLSDRGLPQVQFDAPRLLAHVYLYEIDQFIDAQTAGNFVRWVDDISAAVPNEERGHRLVRDLDALMHTRGIRLNSGKTHVLSKHDAFKFFQVSENKLVDALAKEANRRIKSGLAMSRFNQKCKNRFDKFLRKSKFGHHDKVVRRYLNLFTITKSDGALKYCIDSFARDPSIREACLTYFLALGPRLAIFNMLNGYLMGGFAIDDISICQSARLLTRWQIQPNSGLEKHVRILGRELAKDTYLRRSPFYLTASIWILGKYGTSQQLLIALRGSRGLWSNSEHLARQVVAVVARFRKTSLRSEFYGALKGRGFISAEDVILDHRTLRRMKEPIPPEVRGYVINGKNKTDFGLARMLIIRTVLDNKIISVKYRQALSSQVLMYLTDPIFRQMIIPFIK